MLVAKTFYLRERPSIVITVNGIYVSIILLFSLTLRTLTTANYCTETKPSTTLGGASHLDLLDKMHPISSTNSASLAA